MKMFVFEDENRCQCALWPDNVYLEKFEEENRTMIFIRELDRAWKWIIDKPLDQVVKELEECRNPAPNFIYRTNEDGKKELVQCISSDELHFTDEKILITARGHKDEDAK